MKVNYSFLIILAIYNAAPALAQNYNVQTISPTVGKALPDYFFNDIEYYPKKKAALSEFQGKWIILDFWNQYCSSCVASMPSTNALQNEFKDSIQVLLVGYTGSQYYHKGPDDITIHSLFKRLRFKLGIDLPVAFDSSLFHKIGVMGCPYIIIINPKGIVAGITNSLTDSQMKNLLLGYATKFSLSSLYTKNDHTYNKKLPFEVRGNGSSDTNFIYRSVIANWNSSIPLRIMGAIPVNDHKYEILGIDLGDLYMISNTGTYNWQPVDSLSGIFYPFPILEMKDKSLFIANWNTEVNCFCYSLNIPSHDMSKNKIMTCMQHDLYNYFGYFTKTVKRRMPCWRLKSTRKARTKLKSLGGGIYSSETQGNIILRNCPIKSLLCAIYSCHSSEPTLIDNTHIKGNIDISINCIVESLPDVENALRKEGLYLVKSKKRMTALVIGDQR